MKQRHVSLIMIGIFALALVALIRAQTERYSGTLTVDNATARKIAVGAFCVGNTGGHDGCTNAAGDVSTNDLYLRCETNSIRFWTDGSVPTATTGQLLAIGTPLLLHGHSQVINFTAIATAGSAVCPFSIGRP